MNVIAIIILAALLLNYALELLADSLNLKSLNKDVPEEFKDVYDADTYANAQAYTKTRTRFAFITSTFDLLLLLVFWFSGGFNWLDQCIRSFGFSDLVNGLIFIAGLALAKGIIGLPFSLYSTFVIEERFGFNQTSLSTFFGDLFKGIFLGQIGRAHV